MAKRKTETKWVLDKGKDLVVRLYVSEGSGSYGRNSLCMTVMKMPEHMRSKEFLSSIRIPPRYQNFYLVDTLRWGPAISQYTLSLPESKDRVGKSCRSMIYGGANAARQSYDNFKKMLEGLGAQVLGKGERLTDDPDKEEKIKIRRVRKVLKKPKKRNLFKNKTLANINNIEEESERSVGNISNVVGAATIKEV